MQTARDTQAAYWRSSWLVMAAMLLPMAVYLPSARLGLIYDDHELILAQHRPRNLTELAAACGAHFTRADPRFQQLQYHRPLPRSSYLVQKYLHGDAAAPYHLASVVLIGVVGGLYYGLLRSPPWRVPAWGALSASWLATLHPVASSCVYPVSARETLTPAVFILAAVMLLSRPGLAAFGAGMVCWAAALLSKESAVIVPALVLAADMLCWREERAVARRPGRVTRYLAMALLLAAFFALRRVILGPNSLTSALGDDPWGPLRSFAYTLQTSVAPRAALQYEPRWEIGFAPARAALALAVLVALVIWTLFFTWPASSMSSEKPSRGAARGSLFWAAWVMLATAPTANFFQQETRFDERYVFLPLLGLIGWGATLAAAAPPGKLRRALSVAALMAIVAGATISLARAKYFADDRAFLGQWARSDPASAKARFYHGEALLRAGEIEPAVAEYRAAVALAPEMPEAHGNLGAALLESGQLDEAERELRAAIDLRPEHAEAWLGLGVSSLRRGDRTLAARHFQQALALRPAWPKATIQLAAVMHAEGRPAAAVDLLEQIVRVRPEHAPLRLALANLCQAQGRWRQASREAEQAVAWSPDDVDALNLQAWLRATSPVAEARDGRAAVAHGERILALASAPQPGSLDTLAAALAEAGRFDEAIARQRQALALVAPERRAAFQSRLELYEQGQAYHQPSLAPDEREWEVAEGFRVEAVLSSMQTGPVLALAADARGELFLATEDGPIVRASAASTEGQLREPATCASALRNAQGLLVDGATLYAVAEGPMGAGLYAWPLAADAHAEPRRLVAFEGKLSEHGPHGLARGADGRLYLTVGDETRCGTPPSASPACNFYEGDLPTPRWNDPLGHSASVRAPAGMVLQVDPATGEAAVFATGLRNAYDVAFDRRGRLHAIDSDMEFDAGLPWYRPNRLLRVERCGDFGWRGGGGPWPEHYADSLPALAALPAGSPSGLASAAGLRLPTAWGECLIGGDWARGEIFALSLLKRDGDAIERHTIVARQPLAVTDVTVSGDALYFCTGGRGAKGGVYRVRFDDTESPASAASADLPETSAPSDDTGDPIDASPVDQSSFDQLLARLTHADRFLAWQARTALLERPLDEWLEPLLAHADDRVFALGAIAAAPRLQATAARPRLAARACAALPTAVDEASRLNLLRAIELCLLAGVGGLPVEAATLLEPLSRGESPAVRREALRLAVQLGARESARGYFTLLSDTAAPLEDRVFAAMCLGRRGDWWQPAERAALATFLQASRQDPGRASAVRYLEVLLAELGEPLPITEGSETDIAPTGTQPPTAWTVATLTEALPKIEPRGPDEVARGRELFITARCARCHRHGALGEPLGPDLSFVGRRFSTGEMVRAIVEPARHVPGPYARRQVVLRDGRQLLGMLSPLADGASLLIDSAGIRHMLAASEIESVTEEAVSPMPTGLLDHFSAEEIGELLSFLRTLP